MRSLPVALNVWEPSLVELRPQVSEHLGPWLPRLASLLGPYRGKRDPRTLGEPDGYDGLGRRGSYERLILSEWLLADELPEEFLRRATAGEHLFVQPRRVTPMGSPRTVVLFDCGPDQLGSPRLVHLAVMIVLQRRALAAGGVVHWGYLQEPDAALAEGFDRRVAERFFAQRSRRRPPGALPDGLVNERDVWVVGGPRSAVEGAHHIEVVDPYRPGEHQLVVRLRRIGHRAARELTLPLPASVVCASILARPFGAASWAAPSALAIRGSMRFNASGRVLLAHAGGALRVARLTARGFRRPRVLTARGLVGLGWHKGKLAMLLQRDDGSLVASLHSGRWMESALSVERDARFVLPGAQTPALHLVVLGRDWGDVPGRERVDYDRVTMLVVDGRGALWVLDFHSRRMSLLEAQAAVPYRVGDVLTTMAGAERHVVKYKLDQASTLEIPGFEDHARVQAHRGMGAGVPRWIQGAAPNNQVVLVLLEGNDEARLLRADHRGRALGPCIPHDPQAEVIGGRVTDADDELYVISADRWRVERVTLDGAQPVFTSDEPILWAGTSGMGTIAVWSASGLVHFVGFDGAVMPVTLNVGAP